MGRGILFGVLLLGSALALGSGGKAAAQEFNHTITVYATVPQQRGIYVDNTSAIVKVAGNTSQNIAPEVFDLNNHLLAMTPAIQRQYDDFLKSHNDQLEAGQTYFVNQAITVSTQADSSTIKVDTAPARPLKLSL